MFGFTNDHYGRFAKEAETAFAEYLESKHIQGSELARLTNEFNTGFREGWFTDYDRLESRIQSSLSSDILSQFGALNFGRALGVLAAALRNPPIQNQNECNKLKDFVLQLQIHKSWLLPILRKAVKEFEEYHGTSGKLNLSDSGTNQGYRFIKEIKAITG